MRYGSVCSGIEAATQAWDPLGWKPAFFSEVDEFPSSVLAHRYGSNMPGEDYSSNGVPNYGDMTQFREWPEHGRESAKSIELLVGGTPCQSFSVAGLRGGLDDERGNLMLTYAQIARRYSPRWLVWENVPGVLSSSGGRDFASLLGLLSGKRITVPKDGWSNSGYVTNGKNGYGLAWRVLDAQFVRVDGFEYALPQRRRRVFVVGYSGDWRRAFSVLFERESLSGNTKPSRIKAKGIASEIGGGSQVEGFRMTAFGEYADDDVGSAMKARDFKDATDLVAFNSRQDPDVTGDVSGPIDSSLPQASAFCFLGNSIGRSGKNGGNGFGLSVDVSATLTKEDRHAVICNSVSPTLSSSGPPFSRTGNSRVESEAVVAFAQNSRDEVRLVGGDGGIAGALAADTGAKQQTYLSDDWQVRRLTPNECHRLQGFPDDFCKIPWKGKEAAECPDGHQYKALGNSMAVNCMRWIGMRINMVENIQ